MSGQELILVLAPRGRDAEVIESVLRRGNAESETCADLQSVSLRLDDDLGAVLVTEEALAGREVAALHRWCESQPAWSDLSFIVLTSKRVGNRPDRAAEVLQRLGNVILLERPINAETLISAVRSALRGRRRQYQARSLLVEREKVALKLQALNSSLEQNVLERTRELEGARETLAFALESAELGSWDRDLTTNVTRHSSQYDRIFGYDSPIHSPSRRILSDHVLAEDRKSVDEAFERAIDSGYLDLDCRIRRLDGAIRWIVIKGRVEYVDGRPARMAGIVMDTTARRETEEALRQAQKMEAIGQLTGGVAHDFNNLLTVIVGGLDMMIRRPDQPERVARLAQAAMTAARRGEQLTQQLLAFSRRQLLHPQTLNPNRLLLDFKGLAMRAAGEAIELELELDPAVDPIRIDPAQFESAILNLVVNARDAMPNGGRIKITTRTVRRDTKDVAGRGLSPGQYVIVAVADEGEGMNSETLARVFEPFFTTKEVGKGSGLGLAQVYGFARSAGGDVVINSAPGVGTQVKLYFPRSTDTVSEEVQVTTGKVPLRRAARGETVLLVEDDEQVLGMAIESLEELHYKVIVARNAREALEHLKGPDRIDILFSDVVMPGGMNGAQLAVEARRLRPELKILLTSGYVAEQGADHGIGVDVPVLNKPYRREELARQLRLVLGGEIREVSAGSS
jgi:PAS domain S-box-containing protein